MMRRKFPRVAKYKKLNSRVFTPVAYVVFLQNISLSIDVMDN